MATPEDRAGDPTLGMNFVRNPHGRAWIPGDGGREVGINVSPVMQNVLGGADVVGESLGAMGEVHIQGQNNNGAENGPAAQEQPDQPAEAAAQRPENQTEAQLRQEIARLRRENQVLRHQIGQLTRLVEELTRRVEQLQQAQQGGQARPDEQPAQGRREEGGQEQEQEEQEAQEGQERERLFEVNSRRDARNPENILRLQAVIAQSYAENWSRLPDDQKMNIRVVKRLAKAIEEHFISEYLSGLSEEERQNPEIREMVWKLYETPEEDLRDLMLRPEGEQPPADDEGRERPAEGPERRGRRPRRGLVRFGHGPRFGRREDEEGTEPPRRRRRRGLVRVIGEAEPPEDGGEDEVVEPPRFRPGRDPRRRFHDAFRWARHYFSPAGIYADASAHAYAEEGDAYAHGGNIHINLGGVGIPLYEGGPLIIRAVPGRRVFIGPEPGEPDDQTRPNRGRRFGGLVPFLAGAALVGAILGPLMAFGGGDNDKKAAPAPTPAPRVAKAPETIEQFNRHGERATIVEMGPGVQRVVDANGDHFFLIHKNGKTVKVQDTRKSNGAFSNKTLEELHDAGAATDVDINNTGADQRPFVMPTVEVPSAQDKA